MAMKYVQNIRTTYNVLKVNTDYCKYIQSIGSTFKELKVHTIYWKYIKILEVHTK